MVVVSRNDEEAEYNGFQRRVMGFDAGVPEIPEEPEKPEDLKKHATKEERKAYNKAMDKWIDEHRVWNKKHNDVITSYREDAKEDALIELKKARRVSLFTGDISPLYPYRFKIEYGFGDIVNLYGKFGQVEYMIVSEYTRTEDAEGDRGFPTLITDEDIHYVPPPPQVRKVPFPVSISAGTGFGLSETDHTNLDLTAFGDESDISGQKMVRYHSPGSDSWSDYLRTGFVQPLTWSMTDATLYMRAKMTNDAGATSGNALEAVIENVDNDWVERRQYSMSFDAFDEITEKSWVLTDAEADWLTRNGAVHMHVGPDTGVINSAYGEYVLWVYEFYLVGMVSGKYP